MARKTFEYIAKDPQGHTQKGTYKAQNKTEVADFLQTNQLIPVSIDEVNPVLSLNYLKEINVGGVPLKEKVFFFRQMSTMISAGLSLTRILEVLEMQAQNPRFKKVLTTVRTEVTGGKSLAEAFTKYPDVFDTITISLIRAGEASGNLDKIFVRLAQEWEDKKELQSKIKSAMIYPIIILLVIIGVIALLMVSVIPTMSKIYSEFESDLPLVTRVLIGVSDTFASYWFVFIFVIAAIVLALRFYFRSKEGKMNLDKLLLNVPIFGKLIREIQVATFTRILNLLVSSGMPILEALDLVAASLTNYWFNKAVLDVKGEVERGISMAQAMVSQGQIFPIVVSYMVNVGEESGALEKVLERLAKYYEMEVKNATDNLSTMIEPLMLVLMGGIVFLVAIAVYLPMFQMTQLV